MHDVFFLLAGAVATGLLGLFSQFAAQGRNRRVAARVFLGDIAVAEALFKLLLEDKEWSSLTEFGPTLEAWREYRADFGVRTTAVEWAQVGAFYSNLERAARMARPGRQCTGADLRVAAEMVQYAEHAYTVVAKHVAGTDGERKEVIEQLGEPS